MSLRTCRFRSSRVRLASMGNPLDATRKAIEAMSARSFDDDDPGSEREARQVLIRFFQESEHAPYIMALGFENLAHLLLLEIEELTGKAPHLTLAQHAKAIECAAENPLM